MTFEELKVKLDEAGYVYDEVLATVLYVALTLGRPLLIEGAAGVGKTEVAKVMASALDRELVRLKVWDYSAQPHNLLGQVCLPFAVWWAVLAGAAVILDDLLRFALFGEAFALPRLF